MSKPILGALGALLLCGVLSFAQQPTYPPLYYPAGYGYQPANYSGFRPAGFVPGGYGAPSSYSFPPGMMPGYGIVPQPPMPMYQMALPLQAAASIAQVAPPPAEAGPPAGGAGNAPTTAPVVDPATTAPENGPAGGFFAGYQATFFRPHFEGSGGSSVAPVYDMESGSRYWLGYQGTSGWGFLARYSDYHADAAPVASSLTNLGAGGTTVPVGFPQQSFTVPSGSAFTVDFGPHALGSIGSSSGTGATLLTHFDARVLDLGPTYDFRWDGWSLCVGVGARYANLRQLANQQIDLGTSQLTLSIHPTMPLTLTDAGNGFVSAQVGLNETVTIAQTQAAQQMTLQSDVKFQGWGPLLSLDLQRDANMGRMRGRWFADLRLAGLAGEVTRTESMTLISNGAVAATAFGSTRSHPSVWVAELELGTELGFESRWGEFFLRGSIEGQLWDPAGHVLGDAGAGDELSLTGILLGAGWRR